MLTQNVSNEKSIEQAKLTIEEIKQFPAFEKAEENEINLLREFIFQFGVIIYKTVRDEQS